ncbi:MAG: hypothetical protein AAFQ82_07475 [Myxococcota bacterium]
MRWSKSVKTNIASGGSVLYWGDSVTQGAFESALRDAGVSCMVHDLASGTDVSALRDAPVVALMLSRDTDARALHAVGELARERGAGPTFAAIRSTLLRELEVDLREYFSTLVGVDS